MDACVSPRHIHRTARCPSTKAASIARRSSASRPPWWNATPWRQTSAKARSRTPRAILSKRPWCSGEKTKGLRAAVAASRARCCAACTADLRVLQKMSAGLPSANSSRMRKSLVRGDPDRRRCRPPHARERAGRSAPPLPRCLARRRRSVAPKVEVRVKQERVAVRRERHHHLAQWHRAPLGAKHQGARGQPAVREPSRQVERVWDGRRQGHEAPCGPHGALAEPLEAHAMQLVPSGVVVDRGDCGVSARGGRPRGAPPPSSYRLTTASRVGPRSLPRVWTSSMSTSRTAARNAA